MGMKQTIIRKGGALFKEHGYAAVTVQDICEECDITKTTFYYHLQSKQDILLQLYDIIVDDLTPLLKSMLHTTSSWEQIKALFDHLITSFKTLSPDLNAQLLIVNLQRKEQALRLREELEELAIEIIENGQKQGLFKNPNDPKAIYQASAFMFTGYEYMWCANGNDFDWRKEFFTSLKIILGLHVEQKR